MDMRNEELTQQQYKDKLAEVATLAVHYVKTDRGYYSMRDAFNELAEQSGADKGINSEATIGRRKILAQSVCIECIPHLGREANAWLQDQLYDIAEDIHPRRGMHR